MAADLWALCLAATGALPGSLWRDWSLSPAIVLPLAGLLVWLLRTPVRSRAMVLAAWGLAALALVSPLCRLAASLASAHMVQFMLLAIIVPALLAWGRPMAAAARMLPIGVWSLAYAAVIWVLHVPAVYSAALTGAAVHLLTLAILLAVSTGFWNAVLSARGPAEGRAVIAVFATMAHTGLLGALLTFAASPLYPVQAAGAVAWGFSPLEDQQLAGLVMWVPGGMLYLAAALALAGRWLVRRNAETATG